MPYVGAGVLASALCMDKVQFKAVMAHAGMPQVDHRAVVEERFREERAAVLEGLAALGLPVFVKPARLGSSVGIAPCARRASCRLRSRQLSRTTPSRWSKRPRAESRSSARWSATARRSRRCPERSCSPRARRAWYDYEAKYTPGKMQLIVPARIPERVRERVRELALRTFVLTGCCGLARVDFFVEGERVLVNELNTIPGFTETSVFGSLFGASGLPYPELLDRLLGLALERYEAEQAHTH